jgi:hypothetical protein
MYFKKKWGLQITLLLISSAALLISCNKKKVSADLEASIKKVYTDFNASNMSYLISENGTIVSSYSGDEAPLDSNNGKQFISELAAPLLLNKLIRDSILKEDSSINKLLLLRGKKTVYPNDLISVPANLDDPALRTPLDISAAISLLAAKVKTKGKINVNSFITSQLNINNLDNTQVFFNSVNTVSEYFDRSYPFYKNGDTSIVTLAPTWYTRNASYFFGWNVLKLQKQTVLWKYANFGKRHMLVIKYIDKDILVAISYNSKNIVTPFSTGKNDLLQSPFGIAVLKTLLTNKPAINYTASGTSMYNRLLRYQSSPLYIIYLKEIIAYANLYEEIGKPDRAKILFNVYNKLIKDPQLSKMVKQPELAQIDYVADNADVVKPFEIKKASEIQIFAAGQAIKNEDYINAAYLYDNLQIFFNKNTDARLIKREENKELEFNYRYDKIHVPPPVGWIKDSTIKYAYSDPTDTSYVLEIAIPWSRLDCLKPTTGAVMAMNIFIGDSDIDENQRKSILSWTVKTNEDYNDPNIFGRIKLLKKARKNTDKNLNSLKVISPPIIDGLADQVWDQIYFSPIALPFQGAPSASDNSARFKSLYDDHNLYLLFCVTDNCKNKTGIVTKDKCWIENAANGEIVWKMNGYIIPGSPSFYVNKKIKLPAGKYNLRYTSDNGNSFDGWYGQSPINGIYGAKLYDLTKPIN